MKIPTWRGNLVVDKEKAACHADIKGLTKDQRFGSSGSLFFSFDFVVPLDGVLPTCQIIRLNTLRIAHDDEPEDFYKK
jgi:hypothetical protein